MISEKIRIIEIINRELVNHERDPLTVSDFDTLYELEIEELLDVREQVRLTLRTEMSEN